MNVCVEDLEGEGWDSGSLINDWQLGHKIESMGDAAKVTRHSDRE